jgi:putative transposase
MGNYNILSDYEKQRKLKEVEAECLRLSKSKYWVLKQLGISKSTYYDWLQCGGVSHSKAPKKVWNKTEQVIEQKIISIRDDTSLYRSERTPVGIVNRLEKEDVFMTSTGVWGVLKRHGKNKTFVSQTKTFLIYPRAQRFLEVVCIDDIALTNRKPRDLAIFNAVDEYSQALVAILFVHHRPNRNDVIELLEQIRINYGKLPKIVRLDNARAHKSLLVKQYCRENGIQLQFIEPGTPQQNWPVESFNGVLKKDVLKSGLWKWDRVDDKQQLLNDYREYYNNRKILNSDPLKRTPHEIATAITSVKTQKRLKYRLLRKHRGQVVAKEAIFKTTTIKLPLVVRNVR